MATQSIVRGNLLEDPELKEVNIGSERRTICELRVMSDVWREGAQGEPVQDHVRTHPVQVTIWGEHLAKTCAEVLRRGMRIQAAGAMHPHVYRYSDSEREAGKQDFFEVRLAADDVTLCLNRVVGVTMRAPRSQTGGQESDATDGALA